ncbi:hypothetical protein G7Y89_g11089 [Cudoniella acicularis]|uniref:LysM domain-containing protein n=1 Tax=Cudoniella acicularis TaxID=354080 RepID=A0A8H4RF53_9HELO|nr:hypothetical protein G7Y89_g11089 [Cudoniella acicularis]
MSTYTIKSGDTFTGIATKLGITVAAIEAANPGVSPNSLQVGEVIQLQAGTYTIITGDTLNSIAANLNTTVAAIEAANPDLVPTDLTIGAQLTIPSPSVTTPVPQQTPIPAPTTTPSLANTYVIQSGDTFEVIAGKFGTTAAAIEAANPGLVPTNLQVGASITIPVSSGSSTTLVTAPTPTTPAPTPATVTPIVTPVPVTQPVPTPSSTSTYTIQAGDTFTTIATIFGTTVAVIEAANPGVTPTTLQVGQIINIIPNASSSTALLDEPGQTGGTAGGTEVGAPYSSYSGPASNYPDPSRWASFGVLWTQNSILLSYNDTPSQIADINAAVLTVAQSSGLDARAILCTIMQESGGNVNVGTTFNGVTNTGIMQAFDGLSFNPADEAGSILQMVKDGSEGTANGPGLLQAFQKYGNYYIAFRTYNSGTPDLSNLNDPMGATADYVEDMANRLMGHVWAGM